MPAVAVLPAIIGAAATTGAAIYTANKMSGAAKDAANMQVAAGDKSLALQEKMWQQSQQNLQPWVQQGSWAVNTMGGLMGAPTPAAGGTTGTTPPAGPSPILGSRGYAWERRVPENETTFGSDPMQPGQGRWTSQHGDSIRAKRLAEIMAQTTADPTSIASQSQSSYVRMRAPDGTVQEVPSSYVDHYTQRGATVVG